MALNDKTTPDILLPSAHSWKYDKKIGSGSEGTVHLWNHIDHSNQKIVSRIVIKNLLTTDAHIISDGPAKGQLLQVYITQNLVPKGATEAYTVPTIGVGKMTSWQNAWRTYHPYYSVGHLDNLVHVNTRSRNSKFLPEPFIWFLLHRMMKAAVAMDEKLQKGPRAGPHVIHNDIKSENILLGHPGSLGKDADYIMYPPAYLGDFGMAYLTSNDETWRNKIRGTVGWCAPELDRGPKPDVPRTTARYDFAPESKTNVWQIGYCILRAMEGNGLPTPVLVDNQDLRYRNDNWTKLTEAGDTAVYSSDLVNVVESCVRYDIADRPSPQTALAQIEQFMPVHADTMDRWGTLSWIKAGHANTQEAKDEDDADEIDDEDEDDTSAAPTAVPITTTGTKRKAILPIPLPRLAKRPKYTDALQRRLNLVATQMKPSAKIGKVRKEDLQFVLADRYKIIIRDDKFFDPKEFFGNCDPAPVRCIDALPRATSGPRTQSEPPFSRASPEIPPRRATSVPLLCRET